MHGFDWNDSRIATLRQLWAEGHSTAEIGLRMGISKNAAVGKAHRLNLPPRQSPIRRNNAASETRIGTPQAATRDNWVAWFNRLDGAQRRAVAATTHRGRCPVLSGGGFWLCTCGVAWQKPEPATPAPVVLYKPIPAPTPAVVIAEPTTFKPRAARPCCWPIGEPGTRGFRFCDVPAVRHSYCQKHAKMAFAA